MSTRTCDYQCGGCRKEPVVALLEYEADIDLSYSLEYGGLIYDWIGAVCTTCLQEILDYVPQYAPWRIRISPIRDVAWANAIRLRSDDAPDWPTPMPSSPTWIAHWTQVELWPTFHSPYEQMEHYNGREFVVVGTVFHPSANYDREILPVFLVLFHETGELIEAWPEEVTVPHQRWRSRPGV